MTLLLTAVCDQFVLSMADRRSSIVRGNQFIPLDDRFNKHVMFSLIDERNIKFNGAATFTGLAQWKNKSGVTVTTDQIIADSLSVVAKRKMGHVFALLAVATALAEERSFLERKVAGRFPGFTVVIGGFLSVIREPFLALITDTGTVPDWDEDSSQVELPAPPPFRIHFAIRCRPTAFLGGYTSVVPVGFGEQLESLISAPGIRAYDAARFMVREIRKASRRTTSIGRRASAILMPADGLADTAIWQDDGEPNRAPIPRMVFLNGQQFNSSEMELDLDNVVIGELPRHGLLFEGMMDGHLRRRLFRRVKGLRSPYKATTTFGLVSYALYGTDPSKPPAEPKWSFKSED